MIASIDLQRCWLNMSVLLIHFISLWFSCRQVDTIRRQFIKCGWKLRGVLLVWWRPVDLCLHHSCRNQQSDAHSDQPTIYLRSGTLSFWRYRWRWLININRKCISYRFLHSVHQKLSKMSTIRSTVGAYARASPRPHCHDNPSTSLRSSPRQTPATPIFNIGHTQSYTEHIGRSTGMVQHIVSRKNRVR